MFGDEEVFGNWSDGCAACLGIQGNAAALGSSSIKKDTSSFHPRNIAARKSRSVPPTSYVVDGKLSNENNYTGFLVLTGKHILFLRFKLNFTVFKES